MGGNNNTDGARRKRERPSQSNVTEQISRKCSETGGKRKTVYIDVYVRESKPNGE